MSEMVTAGPHASSTSGYVYPKPCHWQRSNVEALAAKVRSEVVGNDLAGLVGRLGGKIVAETVLPATDPGAAGTIVVRDIRDFTIHVRDGSFHARERLTIAHELGHYYLHYVVPFKDKDPRPRLLATYSLEDDASQAEAEANWFAFELLMPKAEFALALNSRESDYSIAERFGVPEWLVETRRKPTSPAAAPALPPLR
jgi:hypothetical protein